MIKLIGPYEVIEPIGEGGMGIVYKARAPRLFNQIVAIKTLKDLPNQDHNDQFKGEAENLAKLNHPNLVQILDYGEFEEGSVKKPYLVMQYLSGTSLKDIIKKREDL